MDVEREITVPAPSDDVWDAVVEGGWFGADVEMPLEPGETARFTWPDGTVSPAVVETVERGRRLGFRWLPVERGPDGDSRFRRPSRVDITLEPASDGTRVRVVESPLEPREARRQIGFRALARA